MMQTTRIRRLDRLARSADPEVPLRIIFDWGDGDQLAGLYSGAPKESGATAAGDPIRAAPVDDGEPA
jgi:hypothetical protein